jgi:iron(III) transport system ATP-binding protein
MALLTISALSKMLGGNQAIHSINISIQVGDKLAIVGETGSGKTTLLKMIAGLIQPDAGAILLENEPVQGPNDRLIPGHPGIAYLSQYFELRNNYWVHEILEYANELSNEWAQQLYKVCRIEHLLQRRTNELSGGEKQRIVLASLLSHRPKLLLLDEPFSNLDAIHKQLIKEVLATVSNELSISCVLVAHDPLDVLSWASRLILLQKGKVVQEGDPKQIYLQPVNEYCGAILGEYELIEPHSAPWLSHLFAGNEAARIFCRPEDIILLPAYQENTIAGFVKEVRFCGAYYAVWVWTEYRLMKVRTFSNQWQPGQKVFLHLPLKAYWVIANS